MKAIHSRLRRLENAAAPAEREQPAALAILEARRCRLGPDYVEPLRCPPRWFAECRTIAEQINRARKCRMECEPR
jgi:hypothetical protein